MLIIIRAITCCKDYAVIHHNSELDNGEVLTLINSARISLQLPVDLLCEVEDLTIASPATVSLCVMIHFETSIIAYNPYLTFRVQRFITSHTSRN